MTVFFFFFCAFTAGGVNISGGCPAGTSAPAPSPDRAAGLRGVCLWCSAPARSRWWRRLWPLCAAPTSWSTRQAPATRSCVSSRVWPTSTSSQREAPLSGTPAPPTPSSEPSAEAWWTCPSVYGPALELRTSRQNWRTTSPTPRAKERTAGPTVEAWWRTETVPSSAKWPRLWKESCSRQSSGKTAHVESVFVTYIIIFMFSIFVEREGCGLYLRWDVLTINITDIFNISRDDVWSGSNDICKYFSRHKA